MYKLHFYHPRFINKSFHFEANTLFLDVNRTVANLSLLSLFSNYHFTSNKQAISLYDTVDAVLSKLPVSETYQISVNLVPYDYLSARHHFEAILLIFQDPSHLQFKMNFREEQGKEWKEGAANEDMRRTVGVRSIDYKGVSVETLLKPTTFNELFHTAKGKPVELLQYLTLSGFNPVPESSKLRGDLFYLHLKTLQCIDYHITASPQGFFVNQSKISNYNPAMNPQKTIFVSLLDLVAHLSERYTQNLEKYLSDNQLNCFDYEQRRRLWYLNNFSKHLEKWQDECEHEHSWNNRRNVGDSNDGDDGRYYEWTESFLLAKKWVFQEVAPMELKSLENKLSVYSQFEEIALDGARMLVDGRIFPLNPQDERKKQIYIYKRVFYSMASETIYNHAQEKGEEATPSSSSINTDLINAGILKQMNIPDINILHSVLVNYRGFKIIAQCIIPGLLSGEPNTCTQYGSLDDGKTIETNPEFHEIMKGICGKLHIEDSAEVRDGEGNVKILAASPDVKGILGSNMQKYIVDLFRLSPRDLNYQGEENESCVLRNELIQSYRSLLSPDKLAQLPKINVNIGTSIDYVRSDKTAKQEEMLLDMAKHLRETAVRKLIEHLKGKGQSELTDSRGLSKVFHRFGVNMRYLGVVLNHELLQNQEQIKLCVGRNILVRSLKHLFKLAMRESNILYLNMTISHMLNCIFGRKSHLAILEDSSEQETVEKTEVKEIKKKKKKKKEGENVQEVVAHEVESLIKIEKSVYLSMKPSGLWETVCRIAKARYNVQLEKSILELHETGLFRGSFQKISTLRDLCISIGLVLERRCYNIMEGEDTEKEVLPFSYKNIVSLQAICKRGKHLNKSLQAEIAQADSQLEAVNLKDAFSSLQKCAEKALELCFGEQFCSIQSKMCKACYMLGDYKAAILGEYQIINILESIGRHDSTEIIQSYSRLGFYHMIVNDKNEALYFLYKSLGMMLSSFGEGYPDALINFANIARIYQQNKEMPLAVKCYQKAIQILTVAYPNKKHINLSFCYSSLASLSYEVGDYKRSIDYQQDSVAVLSKLLPENDYKLQDAKKILKVYREICESNKNLAPQNLPPPRPGQENKDKHDRKKK